MLMKNAKLAVWPSLDNSQQLFYTISDKLTAKNGHHMLYK